MSQARDYQFSIRPWHDGVAAIEAAADDRPAALEAALRATLALALSDATEDDEPADARSVPIAGEGDDLPCLVAAMVEALLEEMEFFGEALRDVTVHGVLRRDQGGFVAWGYAGAQTASASPFAPLRLLDTPEVVADKTGRILIRAYFTRDDRP